MALPSKVTAPAPRNPLLDHVEAIETAKQYLDADLAERLKALLDSVGALDLNEARKIGVDNIEYEIRQSITIIKKLREQMDRKDNVDSREVKDLVQMSNSLAKLVIEMHEKVDAARSLHLIEQAVRDAFDEIGDVNLKERYLEILKVRMMELE